MTKTFKISFTVFLLLCGTLNVFAADSAVQSKSSANQPQKSKESPLSFGVDYLFIIDQNQSRSVKSSKHSLDLSGSYGFTQSLSAGLGTAVKWNADGNNVKKTEDNPKWEDLEIQLGYKTKTNKDINLGVELIDALPTGYESRTEGVRNTIGVLGTTGRSFFNKAVNLSAAVGANAIMQTYDYSITTGESNPDSMYLAKIGLGLKIFSGFSLGASYQLWSFHFINGENNLARNQTSLSAKYNFKNITALASYSFGNYDKSDGYKFLFVDDTRQIISLGVAFEI